jgi:hypothetical protein
MQEFNAGGTAESGQHNGSTTGEPASAKSARYCRHAIGCSGHAGPSTCIGTGGCSGCGSSRACSGPGSCYECRSDSSSTTSGSDAFDGSERNDDTGYDHAGTEH